VEGRESKEGRRKERRKWEKIQVTHAQFCVYACICAERETSYKPVTLKDRPETLTGTSQSTVLKSSVTV
jgi:hypothetical protein